MIDLKSRIHLSSALLVILMIFLTITAFSPGAMSPDTIDQLGQALTGYYTDLHSPIMAAFWRLLLLFVWKNPTVLFFVHATLYWCFWYLLAVLVFRGWKGQIMVLGVAALPPLWSQMTVLWADSELTLSLLGAYSFGILASLPSPKNRMKKNILKFISWGICVFLFIYAADIRKNSLLALIPLAFFVVRGAFEKISKTRIILFTCGFCALALLAGVFINYGCLKAKKEHVYQLLETFDLAGVFFQTGRVDLIPGYWKTLNGKLTPEMLTSNYSPYSAVPLTFWGEPVVRMTNDPAQLKELNQKWLMAIRLFPAEFLRHRWGVFKRLMGIGEPKIYYALFFEIVKNQFNIQDHGDPQLGGAIKSYFIFFRNSFFFRGWVYLCFLLALISYQWFRLSNGNFLRLPSICAALSGLLYGLGYFAYAPSAEFRFLYPVVALFFTSLVLTVSARQAETGTHFPKRFL